VGGRRIPGEGKKVGLKEVMGVSVEVVRKPKKPLPEEVAKAWAAELAKEGKEIDWQRLMPPKGFRVLPSLGGWWRGPSRGSATTAGWPKISRGYAPLERPSFTLQ
jgi:hypothetical protein